MTEAVISDPGRLFFPYKCFLLNSLTAKAFSLDKTALAAHPPVSTGFACLWLKPALDLRSNL